MRRFTLHTPNGKETLEIPTETEELRRQQRAAMEQVGRNLEELHADRDRILELEQKDMLESAGSLDLEELELIDNAITELE